MRIFFGLLLVCPLFAEIPLLSDADLLSERYNKEVAKAPPPSLTPKAEDSLDRSIWLTLDLTHLKIPKETTALEELSSSSFFQMLSEMGVEALYLQNLKEKSSFAVRPSWGNYGELKRAASMWNLSLVGDCIESSTGWGPDFELALQNSGEYPSLYHLIEIAVSDWPLLPSISPGQLFANVPWLTLQELHRKGYVPEHFSPYIKESSWNATIPISGVDGKKRRWIYLKGEENDPVLSWLSPTFGAGRIAAAGALDSIFRLNQKMLTVESELPLFAKETFALWVRKLGGFSIEKTNEGILGLEKASSDLIFDTLTRTALLHALIAEDAGALRLIYDLFLEGGVETRRLVHSLQPFDQFVCDWSSILVYPRKKYKYWQEQVTGEVLAQRLLKEDLYRLGIPNQSYIPPSTWVDYCAQALGIKEVEKRGPEIQKAHLLLAFTYAMQPGAFSFSLADLLGALPEGATSLDPLGVNPQTLYPSLPIQMQSPISFASKLKEMLQVRRDWSLAKGEIVEVPPVRNKGCLLLVQKLFGSQMTLLLALNFGRVAIEESVELPSIRRSNAIDLMENLTQEKVFESPNFSFSLSPLSGKVFLFQQKYYD